MYYARYNFTGTNRSKARSSLQHSLRLAIESTKETEWNTSLSNENFIQINGENGEILSLDKLTKADKKALIDDILSGEQPAKDRKKMMTNRSSYLHKIKSAIESETKNGNLEAVSLLEKLRDTPQNAPISPTIINNFDDVTMSRKSQKMKMISLYFQAHNSLIGDLGTRNKTFMQEAIIKFPHKWGVDEDDLSRDDHMSYLQGFYKRNFPDYPVKMVAYHHDERTDTEKTGAHAHTFISARNEKTGEYDLIRAQVKFVNEYIELNEPDEPAFPLERAMKYAENQRFGSIFQKIMYKDVAANLLKDKEIQLTMSPEQERRSELRKRMKEESRLPKSQRIHSHLTRMNELELAAKDKIVTVSHELKHVLDEKEIAQNAILAMEEEVTLAKKKIHIIIDDAKIELVDLQKQHQELQHKNSKAEDSIKTKQLEVAKLNRQKINLEKISIVPLAEIIKTIFYRVELILKKVDKEADKTTAKILKNFEKIDSTITKKLIVAAAMVADESLTDRKIAQKLIDLDHESSLTDNNIK